MKIELRLKTEINGFREDFIIEVIGEILKEGLQDSVDTSIYDGKNIFCEKEFIIYFSNFENYILFNNYFSKAIAK